jgi:hypothetical protein
VTLAFGALRSFTDREVLIAVMVHIERMLSGKIDRFWLFATCLDQHYEQVVRVLLNSLELLSSLERSLKSSDEYVSTEAARLLCIASRYEMALSVWC